MRGLITLPGPWPIPKVAKTMLDSTPLGPAIVVHQFEPGGRFSCCVFHPGNGATLRSLAYTILSYFAVPQDIQLPMASWYPGILASWPAYVPTTTLGDGHGFLLGNATHYPTT
jgi:hypothetical protein